MRTELTTSFGRCGLVSIVHRTGDTPLTQLRNAGKRDLAAALRVAGVRPPTVKE